MKIIDLTDDVEDDDEVPKSSSSSSSSTAGTKRVSYREENNPYLKRLKPDQGEEEEVPSSSSLSLTKKRALSDYSVIPVAPKRPRTERKFILGVDPAYRNEGLGWLNTVDSTITFQVFDYTVWDGYAHDMTESACSEQVIKWVRKLRPRLEQTRLVAIEAQ